MGWTLPSWMLGGISVSDEQARSDQLDRELSSMNTRDYSPGGVIYQRILVEEGQSAASEAQRQATENLGTQISQGEDLAGQVNAEFAAGARQGWQNITGGVHNFLDSVGLGIFKAVPLWLWALGAVGLFIYLGGGQVVRRQIAKL